MGSESSEIIRFIQTWLVIYLSLSYCFFTGKLMSAGKIRFLLILPVVGIFLLLPLRLTSVNLGGCTAFFIAWLATFKLVLFSFNKGPLSSDPSISLLRFLAAGSLPIKITQKLKFADTPVAVPAPEKIWKPAWGYVVKAVLMAVVFKLYDFKARLHPAAFLSLYCFNIYFFLEFILAVSAAAARAGLGVDLEPQIDEPYLATSLQDFWARRWNLMVTSILRPTVYEPVMGLLAGPLTRDQAQSMAVMATFATSAVMHQLIIYYLNLMKPTGQMSAFFLLHGLCVVAEKAAARHFNGKWRLPRIVSSSLTIFFVMSTAFWLFFPEILRSNLDVRSFQEYHAVGEFLESVINGSLFRSFNGIVSIQHFFTELLSFKVLLMGIGFGAAK